MHMFVKDVFAWIRKLDFYGNIESLHMSVYSWTVAGFVKWTTGARVEKTGECSVC